MMSSLRADRRAGVRLPGGERAQGGAKVGDRIGGAAREGGRLVGQRGVQGVGLKASRRHLPAKPRPHLRVDAAIKRKRGVSAVENRERQVGHVQSEPSAIRERVGDEPAEAIIPAKIGMAVVRLGRNIRESRPRQPLCSDVGQNAGRTQAGAIEVPERVPFGVAHGFAPVRLPASSTTRLSDPPSLPPLGLNFHVANSAIGLTDHLRSGGLSWKYDTRLAGGSC